MADKPFGVRQLNIVGAAGTPTIESAAELRIGGQQVAITTNTSVTGVVTATSFAGNGANITGISTTNITDYGVGLGGGGGVPANLTATTLDVVGIVTAGSFVTDLITSDGTGRGFCTRYYITANGSSDYRFAGPGQRNTVGNPTLYLMRGFTYMFENSTGGSHPFRIQFTGTSTGVGTYVSGSQTGIQIFTIPHDAPASYQYQCTAHGGMLGTFVIPS
jgi:hypothetical protein